MDIDKKTDISDDHSRTYEKEDIEMLLRGYAAEEKMTPEMCECIQKFA